MKKKILLVGPNVEKSFGGMVTVINQICTDAKLKEKFSFELYPTYIDGPVIKRVFYSLKQCIAFLIKRKGYGYDLVHFHMASNSSTTRKMFLSKQLIKKGIPYIVHIHGADFDEFYDKQSKKKREKISSFLNDAKCVVALSKYWENVLKEKLGIVNVVTINNCIDTKYYEQFANNKNHMIPSFLFLGRVSKRKGVWDLLESASILKKEGLKFNILVAGDGENERFQELVAEKELENYITQYGWAGQQLKDELLSKTDALILPSYNEGLPMSILESMAAGKVIISSYAGAIPEVIKENVNGYLVHAGNINEIVSAMKKCFDVERNQTISYNNLKYVKENYDISVFENKVEDIYL